MFHTHTVQPRSGRARPPAALLIALLAQVGLSFLPQGAGDPPWAVTLAGGFLILAGVVLNVIAVRGFAGAGAEVRPGSALTALVTGGVFRWTRNPMYLGICAILIGAAGALGSVWALVVVPAFVAWISPLIRFEEERLEATFGDAYRTYRTRVRRWL